jgi:hypothetical protein
MKKRDLLRIAVLLFGAGLFLGGCADQNSRTVEHTTTNTSPPSDDQQERNNSTTESTTTTQSEEHHDSVLGATANAVGTIIAAPFRIVGDAFETIF